MVWPYHLAYAPTRTVRGIEWAEPPAPVPSSSFLGLEPFLRQLGHSSRRLVLEPLEVF